MAGLSCALFTLRPPVLSASHSNSRSIPLLALRPSIACTLLTYLVIIADSFAFRAWSEGERGWDVFSLSYDVGAPLSTVLTPAAMMAYKRIFKLLWDVKHVEHSLSEAWHTMKPNSRHNKQYSNSSCGT